MDLDEVTKLLNTNICDIINPNKTHREALLRLGLVTVRDALLYRPTEYAYKRIFPSIRSVKSGEIIVSKFTYVDSYTRKSKIEIIGTNESGERFSLIFFRSPHQFVLNKLLNTNCIIEGKANIVNNCVTISHPTIVGTNYRAIEPVYPLTYGVVNRQVHTYIVQILSKVKQRLELFEVQNNNFCVSQKTLISQIMSMHDPMLSHHTVQTNIFKYELYAHKYSVEKMKLLSSNARSFSKNEKLQSLILHSLQFNLTVGQIKAMEQIEYYQKQGKMFSLLNGDVGVGKTLVALLSCINVTSNNVQCAIMAPTDILANQHYQFFKKTLEIYNVKVGLLTSRLTSDQRKSVLEQISTGMVHIVIGTQSLLQSDVVFHDLAYVIIDEQHRFGVNQRIALISKGNNPHVLLMTATPIPRSLSMGLIGDIDMCTIETKISNRMPVNTICIESAKVGSIIDKLQVHINSNFQIYWVCKIIKDDEGEKKEGDIKYTSLYKRFETLKSKYDRVGILHGEMKQQEKERVMGDFLEKKIMILVCTTVIEVGIDVSSATLIVVEDANTYGLAQLHQLRGRVGRSNIQSYCILLYNKSFTSAIAAKRLQVMKVSDDGFCISEEDLKLRGPGDFLGVKQSGNSGYIFGDIDISAVASTDKKFSNHPYENFLIELFGGSRIQS